jgi:hypothetical protein
VPFVRQCVKNIVEPERRMRSVCWIPKATDTHSEYVIFTAVPPQQWLHENASRLRYTYIACLVQFKQVAYDFFDGLKYEIAYTDLM